MSNAIVASASSFGSGLRSRAGRIRTDAHITADAVQEGLPDSFGILREAQLVGAGIVFVAILIFVLTEVYDAITIEDTNPWYEVVEALEGTGAAALGLLILGFLVLAAAVIMGIMNNGGFGGAAR